MNIWLLVILAMSPILFLAIFLTGGLAASRVIDRADARLLARQRALEEVLELERRRKAHDSGRKHAVRADAGPPAVIREAKVAKKRARPRKDF